MTESNPLKIRNKEQSALCSGLYLVPTPIGNLRDITLRALDILTACDILVCEDARVTGKLLKAYGLSVPKKIIYNDHADEAVKRYILDLALDGNVIAIVSDAGAPMISDPGYKLVRDAIEKGVYITALPGANAVLPALQLSTLGTDYFSFLGFLPSKEIRLKNFIESYIFDKKETLIMYDSPNRLKKTLAVFDALMPDRRLAVAREISKLFEQVWRGTASEILTNIGEGSVKGEIVIVIEGQSVKGSHDAYDLDKLILNASEAGATLKELSSDIAAQTGLKKKEIYNHALKILKK